MAMSTLLTSLGLTIALTALTALAGCATSAAPGGATSGGTLVFITRHAEKAGQTTDPDLTPTGRRRAADLASELAPFHVTSVYSTTTKRARQTAAPTVERSGAADHPVPPATSPAALARMIRSEPTGSVILVVSHSNVIPSLLSELGVAATQTPTEADFDLLWALRLGSGGGGGGGGGVLLHEGPLPWSPPLQAARPTQ